MDPSSSLGLSMESILSYSLGHYRRVMGAEPPETPPSRCLAKSPSCLGVTLKGERTERERSS